MSKFKILIVIFSALLNSYSDSEITTSASSVLNGKSRYSNKNCVDGDYRTPWVEGSSSNGVGEWIKLDFSSEKELSYLGVIPGYLKYLPNGENLFQANNRIKKATIELSDHTLRTVHFAEYEAIQYIKINKKTSYVKLIIDSVYAGDKYNDAGISEIVPVYEQEPVYNESWAYDYENTPNDIVYLKYIHNYCVSPILIEFENNIGWGCGGVGNPFEKLNDSTYSTERKWFGVGKGAEFKLTPFGIEIKEVFQRSEYRLAFGGTDSESPYFYNQDSTTVNSASYCTDWSPLMPVKGEYTVIEISEPKTVNGFIVKSIIPKKRVLQFRDSLLTSMGSPHYLKDKVRLLKFATHIKITYTDKGEVKNLYLLLIDTYGEC